MAVRVPLPRGWSRVRKGSRLSAAVLLLGLGLVRWEAAAAPGGPPRVVYLWFADGSQPPPTMPALCRSTPPAYVCSFAATPEACRQEVQRWLDRWYADFNLVFTYQRPALGPYDTIVVSHESAWCTTNARSTSLTPATVCEGVPAGAAVIFQCGQDAKRCAGIIAQEQAHALGLDHTTSPSDVMNPEFPPDHDGFEDRDNNVGTPPCRRPQNSYRLMLERLGPWPGGSKPAPAGPPLAPGDAGQPADAAEGGDVSAEVDGDAAGAADAVVDGGTDAPLLPDAPMVVEPPPVTDHGGCSCTTSRAPPSVGLGSLVLAMGSLALATRNRRRRRRT